MDPLLSTTYSPAGPGGDSYPVADPDPFTGRESWGASCWATAPAIILAMVDTISCPNMKEGSRDAEAVVAAAVGGARDPPRRAAIGRDDEREVEEELEGARWAKALPRVSLFSAASLMSSWVKCFWFCFDLSIGSAVLTDTWTFWKKGKVNYTQ